MHEMNHDPQPPAHPFRHRLARGNVDPTRDPRPLHRIAEVRQQEHVSMRSAQQALGLSNVEVQEQEDPNYDLRLSELYRWQELLGVPLAELLAEPARGLSRSVFERAAMVKAMKTAATIMEQANRPNMQTLAQRLIEQMLEIMPELHDVAPWPTVGQRRTLQDLGRIAENVISHALVEE